MEDETFLWMPSKKKSTLRDIVPTIGGGDKKNFINMLKNFP